MIQDLHSHTKYSFCSADKTVEDGVIMAIKGGIELFGINDHNYGVGYARFEDFVGKKHVDNSLYEERLRNYNEEINQLKLKYKDKIKILSGIEIATVKEQYAYPLPKGVDVSFFDYCLIEHLGAKTSIIKDDLFGFVKSFNCQVGLAHTDLFNYAKSIDVKPFDFFSKMAKDNVFWELNVNYDSTHGYREHQYVLDFFNDKDQQMIVKESGVKLSVGFDGHKAEDYDANRVKKANEMIRALGIPLVFDE